MRVALQPIMTPISSFILLLHFIIFSLTFPLPLRAVIEQYDPTQQYSAESASTYDTPQIIEQSSIYPSLHTDVQLDTLNTAIVVHEPQVDAFIFQQFLGIFEFIGSHIFQGADQVAWYLVKYRTPLLATSVTLFLSLGVVSPLGVRLPYKIFQSLTKAELDVLIRAVAGIVALLSVTVATSYLIRYSELIKLFEQKTGWQVGYLEHDLFIIGAVASFLSLILLGEYLHAGFVSGTIPVASMWKQIKKLGSYILKETKSAFIETEKECKARVDQCADWIDKGIILAFNYLPGTMPDLGFADMAIELKNKMLDSGEDKRQRNSSTSEDLKS